jgi:hypothetical protein
MRVAATLALRKGDGEKLARMAASRADSAGVARRARIVLLAADGLPHTEIAGRCGTSLPTVRYWRSRNQAGGIRALEDLPPGHPPRDFPIREGADRQDRTVHRRLERALRAIRVDQDRR